MSAERAFAALTAEIGAWWPLARHMCSGEPTAGLRFTNGELVETPGDGSRQVWGEVLRWEPPHGLAMTWHPGGDAAGAAGEVEPRTTSLSTTRSLVEAASNSYAGPPTRTVTKPPSARVPPAHQGRSVAISLNSGH